MKNSGDKNKFFFSVQSPYWKKVHRLSKREGQCHFFTIFIQDVKIYHKTMAIKIIFFRKHPDKIDHKPKKR